MNFFSVLQSKICSHELMINSTFDQPMDVQSITFQPNDSRFYYLPAQKETKVTLQPLSITNVSVNVAITILSLELYIIYMDLSCSTD